MKSESLLEAIIVTISLQSTVAMSIVMSGYRPNMQDPIFIFLLLVFYVIIPSLLKIESREVFLTLIHYYSTTIPTLGCVMLTSIYPILCLVLFHFLYMNIVDLLMVLILIKKKTKTADKERNIIKV